MKLNTTGQNRNNRQNHSIVMSPFLMSKKMSALAAGCGVLISRQPKIAAATAGIYFL